jgi:mannose-6-phosphate isomerase-like protein (cupin superfamily)
MISRRPWGTCEVLTEEPGYKCKRITVEPGHELSMQYHQHRNETWTVVQGRGRAEVGMSAIVLNADGATSEFKGTPIYKWNIHPGTTLLIPAQCIHRVKCLGESDEPLVIIEVQRGHCLGEDDITRLDDAYGRATS